MLRSRKGIYWRGLADDMPARATSTSFGAARGNEPGRRPGPMPGKRRVKAEQREAALSTAL